MNNEESSGKLLNRQEEVRKNIVKQYIAYRKLRKMTQEELANRMGIKRPNISRFETGEYNPTLDLLVKMAESMNLEINITLKSRTEEEGRDEKSVKKLTEKERIRGNVPGK